MTTIQAELAAICKLLEARTVECPTCVMVRNSLVDCGDHIGSSPRGRIPDPQYDALRRVVQEVRWCVCSSPDCTGSAYGPRDVSQWPPGALAGALVSALYAMGIERPMRCEWAFRAAREFNRSGDWAEDNPDVAAAQAVRKELEVTP